MTRKEEIKQEAEFLLMHGEVKETKDFIKGAEWADQNPDKRLIYTKQELLDMGFAFTLNGNIVTPQEANEVAENYYNFRKSQWLKKACEWLSNMINSSKNAYELHGMYSIKTEVIIEDFKKAMKEDS